jgi:hypothetical protein
MARFAFYIYYRIAPGAAVAARDRVRAAQADIATALPVCARLLEKYEEPDLWMEVYEGIDDAGAFERALAAAVERHALDRLLLPGTSRKIECFVVPPCA